MSSPNTDGSGYAGQAGLNSGSSQFNAMWFLVRQYLGLIRTATLVQVKAVTNDGGVRPVGTVDVLPLVNLIDGLGNSSPHGIVNGLPYARVQGGNNAVICDPQVGDIGVAVFADRDISSVKAAQGQASPGSRRRFNMADGVYVFSVITQSPTQYVQFTDDGINIVDKSGNQIQMQSDGIYINGIKFDRSQNISEVDNINGSGEVTFNGHTLTQHKHGGVTTGSSQTATPTG